MSSSASHHARHWLIAVLALLLIGLLAPALARADQLPRITGTEARITSDPGDQYDPSIHGQTIVFTDYRAADTDVHYYDLATQTEHPVVVAPGNQELTSTWGGKIVYTDYRSNDVCLFDTATGVTTNLTAPDKLAPVRAFRCVDPAIGGQLVAWEDNRDGNNEIYAMNLATGEERRISYSTNRDAKPAVWGDSIVWQRAPVAGGNCNVWVYDWATQQTTEIPWTGGDYRQPQICGDHVVYQCLVNGDQDIFCCDIDTGVTQQLKLAAGDQANPHATIDSAGNLAVSFDDLSTGMYHVRLWFPATNKVYEVTSGSSGQYLNSIDGDHIVYTDDRNGDLDVYMYTFVPTHKLKVTQPAPGEGTISLGGQTAPAPSPVPVYDGDNQTFTITPAAAWKVTDITVDGQSVLGAAQALGGGAYSYTFSDVTADHTISAAFTSLGGLDVTTFAGAAGQAGSTDATGGDARFSRPLAVACDTAGNVYVADTYNDTIRKIAPSGQVTTLAGRAKAAGNSDGKGSAAQFNGPWAIACDAAGELFVADMGSDTIRKVTPDGTVSTIAGQCGVEGSDDGVGSAAQFYLPQGIACNAAGTVVYVADTNNFTIRKLTRDQNSGAWTVSTLAGQPGQNGGQDGPGGSATFWLPAGLVCDPAGDLYVADGGGCTIREVSAAGVVTTIAGQTQTNGSSDGSGSSARFSWPLGIARDGSGDLYIADYWNDNIREITPDGMVSTVAGKAGVEGATDGRGSDALFFHPAGIACDPAGNVFISDGYNDTIRKGVPTWTARSFVVSGIANRVTAGASSSVTITALDANGNTAAGYTGTVHLTSSDGRAVLPADSTFTAADKGSKTITGVVLKSAGPQTVTATDALNASIAGSRMVAVGAGLAESLNVTWPDPPAGVPTRVTVTAQDEFGNTASDYSGTVTFGSSDLLATLPGPYTFTTAGAAPDDGTHTFDVVFFAAGAPTFTVSDAANGLSGASSEIVTSAPPSALDLSAPATVVAGQAFNVTVTALDPYGNPAADYNGTVALTASDARAVLPDPFSYAAGAGGGSSSHTFSVTLGTAGVATLSAADESMTAPAATITVSAPPDTTPPTTSADSAPQGWTVGPVTVTLSAQDESGGSGVAATYYQIGESGTVCDYAATGPFAVNDAAPIHYWSVDKAGNIESTKSVSVMIDSTTPVTHDDADDRWHNADVTVHFKATDALSGSAYTQYSTDGGSTWTKADSALVSREGVTTIQYRSADKAGNVETAKNCTVRIDKTAPTIIIRNPVSASGYVLGQVVLADYAASDAGSGVSSTLGAMQAGRPVMNGTAVDTAGFGPRTFVVTATDLAGNTATATVTYSVTYSYGGAVDPINADGSSVFKLNSTMPLRLSVFNSTGQMVGTLQPHLYLSKLSNSVWGSELEAASTNAPDAGNVFIYLNASSGYKFNLSTKQLSTGTWRLRVDLGNGGEAYAIFSLR